MGTSRDWATTHFETFCGRPWNCHGPGVCVIYCFCLHWVSIAARCLFLVTASENYSSCSAQASHSRGFSCYVAWAVVCRLSSCGS